MGVVVVEEACAGGGGQAATGMGKARETMAGKDGTERDGEGDKEGGGFRAEGWESCSPGTDHVTDHLTDHFTGHRFPLDELDLSR